MKSAIRASFSLVTGALLVLFLSGSLPVRGDDWSAWKHRLPIRLEGVDPDTVGLLPVDVTFSLKADLIGNPAKEFRLLYETKNGNREVPFQLSHVALWKKDLAKEKSLATLNGRITFFDVSGDAGAGGYVLLYGNPAAAAPSYDTYLQVTGKKPSWTIENAKIKVELSGGQPGPPTGAVRHEVGKSGQLAAVTVRSRPDPVITNPRRLLHWNPDIFIPARGWLHAYAWDPPEVVEIEQGPLFVEVRRRGPFPRIPEVDLAITYRMFAGHNYIESDTRMDLRKDLGVVALRNDELAFNQNLFTDVAWESEGEVFRKPMAAYPAVNKHGDFLRLPPDVPFVAFFSPEKKLGAATIRLSQSGAGPHGTEPVYFDHATYLARGEELQYWFRSLVYFSVSWDRTQLLTVPKGSVYAERNLYCFYDTVTDGDVEGVVRLSRAARHRPDIRVGEVAYPPSQ